MVTIGGLTALAAILLFIGAPILVEVLLGGGEFGPEVATTAAIVAAFAVSVPFDALAYPLSRGLPLTTTIRQVGASFAGFGVVIASSTLLAPNLGLLAIPLGYALGMVVRTPCWPSSSPAASGRSSDAGVGRDAGVGATPGSAATAG